MKIGFSSLVCPNWDFKTVVTQAAAWGYDGVELRGLRGQFNLPLLPEVSADPEGVRRMLAEQKVELVCLSASASMDARNKAKRAEQRELIVDFIDLAGRLRCPFVKVFAGEVQRFDTREAALSRIVEGLAGLAPLAARVNVTLLVENSGDFSGSADLWYIADAVNHPALRVCWNQVHAMTGLERPTVSIPRLGSKIAMVHVGDADYSDSGVLEAYKAPGSGMIDVARQIELLKGVVYRGYLMFEWPKAWVPSLPEPESVLPETAKVLRACVNAKQDVLSAYKGDKNAARFKTPGPAQAAR